MQAEINSPFTGGQAILKREYQHATFRKESFEYYAHYYQCVDTGEEFSTTELDALNLLQIHNQYRAQHHIPFPQEIASIRQQYGLSAAKMAEVLDLGINSYRQYEQGEIPSLSNAKLIRLAKDPHNFERFAAEKETKFSSNAYQKLLLQIQALKAYELRPVILSYLWNQDTEANPLTGFVKPHFEKVAHFVLFFAKEVKPLKTRLNKLLFYSDFLHFKRTGFAISGCNYRAIQMGPVPSHFHELFGILDSQGYIRIEEELSEHGNIGERFHAQASFDASLFTEAELSAMQQVAETFTAKRTREIIDLSHEEEAWKQNVGNRQIIDYQKFAFLLKHV